MLVGTVGTNVTLTLVYNNDPDNLTDSEIVPVTFKVIAGEADKSANVGMIVGIVAGVVVLIAAGVVAFVMVNKKKQTNTKAGSRGNRF